MDMQVIKSLRKFLRPVRRAYEKLRISLLELPFALNKKAAFASSEWLIMEEVKYGGYVTNVSRNKVSSRDPRSASELAFGGMTGGDRMLHNNYAPAYSKYIQPFINTKKIALIEVGILKGTGLAIWCDLFPGGRIVGLDIDLSHFLSNKPELERRGAFSKNSPEIHQFDQLIDGSEVVKKIMRGATIDIVIDDGLHSFEAIRETWLAIKPNLSQSFVYFVEDYPGLIDEAGDLFSGCECTSYGNITVIRSMSESVS